METSGIKGMKNVFFDTVKRAENKGSEIKKLHAKWLHWQKKIIFVTRAKVMNPSTARQL